MISATAWTTAFRQHTCYQGLAAVLDSKQRDIEVTLQNEHVPPCRACRALWRRARFFGIAARFQWPGGTWSNENAALTETGPSPQIVRVEERDGEMSIIAVENQSVLRWGFRRRGAGSDPVVLQSRIRRDGAWGAWTNTREHLSSFWCSVEYWNLANGDADVTVFGEAKRAPNPVSLDLVLTWDSPGLRVWTAANGVHCVFAEKEFHVFGADRASVDEVLARIPYVARDVEDASEASSA